MFGGRFRDPFLRQMVLFEPLILELRVDQDRFDVCPRGTKNLETSPEARPLRQLGNHFEPTWRWNLEGVSTR
jgi:hypothetical protein